VNKATDSLGGIKTSILAGILDKKGEAMEKTKEISFFTLGHQGLIAWAICTNLPLDEAVAHANRIGPTGISSSWSLSEDKFPDGKDNPHDCPDNPGNKHYLLEC